MIERRRRSIVKVVSWRIIATLTTATLVYLFTGKLTIAFEVGILEAFFKLLLYYGHERAWNKISWGRAGSR